MSISVRRAIPGEAPGLAQLAAALFRQGYAETHPEPELSLYVARTFSTEAFARYLGNPRATVLVAEETPTGKLMGYALLREGWPTELGTLPDPEATTNATEQSSPPPIGGENPIEIVRFYVDRTRHGSGVAQALMAECVLEAVRRGNDVVWLQAWQNAARPLAFYKKLGFVVVGTATFEFGTRLDEDFLLVRTVAASTAH